MPFHKLLSFFFGAGFSKWAANLPLADELFDYQITPWAREQKKLDRVKTLKSMWDENHPNGLTEQFIADATQYANNDREAVVWYIVRRLSEPFVWKEYSSGRYRRHVLMIDENRRHAIEGVRKAMQLINIELLPSISGIITTNYDMLVEYSLSTKRFNYGIENQSLTGRGPYPLSQYGKGKVLLSGKIPLAKIHGSINWDDDNMYSDGRRGISGHAKIVPPSREKKPEVVLSPHWRLAEQILLKTSRLLIFGFGFNDYDEAVRGLLKKNGARIASVFVVNRTSKVNIAKEWWPNADIEWALPPPDDDGRVKEWILKDSEK
jgi:hypothetical protein